MATDLNVTLIDHQVHHYQRSNKGFVEHLADGVDLIMMQIPSGDFLRGAPDMEPQSDASERPQSIVNVPSFFMGSFPITEIQWRIVSHFPSEGHDLKQKPSKSFGDNYPIVNVRWNDAEEYCKRLSTKLRKSYRLPTEAEWEYACRAGTTAPFHFGETLMSELANYRCSKSYNGGPVSEDRSHITETGSFHANDWGLYDMHGNVLEWCQDHWHATYKGAPDDGSAWNEYRHIDRLSHVLRGGSWDFDPRLCRSASRYSSSPDVRSSHVGFRVVVSAPKTFQ